MRQVLCSNSDGFPGCCGVGILYEFEYYDDDVSCNGFKPYPIDMTIKDIKDSDMAGVAITASYQKVIAKELQKRGFIKLRSWKAATGNRLTLWFKARPRRRSKK